MNKRATLAAGLVLIVTLGISGCRAEPGADASPGPSASPTQSGDAAPGGPENPAPENPGPENGEGAPPEQVRGIINSTALGSCDTTPGTVVAEGTVTAPEDGTVRISVSWTDADTSAILTKQQAELTDLSAGEETTWRVEAELPPTDVTVRCVLGSTLVPAA